MFLTPAAVRLFADRRFQYHFKHQQPPRFATGKTREAAVAARRREHPRVPAISYPGHLRGTPPFLPSSVYRLMSFSLCAMPSKRSETGKENSRL